MILSLIVATSRNGVIGIDNTIPWRIKSDMEHFKKYTMGKSLLMGRKTFESLPTLLEGRTTIILTASEDSFESISNKVEEWKAKHPGKEVPLIMMCSSLSDLFHSGILEDVDELVVCGGSTVYEQLYDFCDKFVHTLVDTKLIGTSYFLPGRKVDFKNDWIKSDSESQPFSQFDGDDYRFYINTYYRPNRNNVVSFKEKKKLTKLETLKLSFPIKHS